MTLQYPTLDRGKGVPKTIYAMSFFKLDECVLELWGCIGSNADNIKIGGSWPLQNGNENVAPCKEHDCGILYQISEEVFHIVYAVNFLNLVNTF